MLREIGKTVSAGKFPGCDALVIFSPMPDEPDFRAAGFPLPIHAAPFVVPSSKNRDPYLEAGNCIASMAGRYPYVLVPGRLFDLYGTRLGRGGGWYDRFLSRLPASWPRIGVAFADQIYAERLVRNAWDEPMDFLAVNDKKSWRIVKCRRKAIAVPSSP
jgi:hypothetical protein